MDEFLSKILIWGVDDTVIFGGALVMEEFGVASQSGKFAWNLNILEKEDLVWPDP